jgi:hypothetical protein
VPVVGWAPLTSLEQLAGLGVFLVLQLLEICEIKRRQHNLSFLQVRKTPCRPRSWANFSL